MTYHDKSWHFVIKIENNFLLRKRAITSFLSRKFMITRSSIAFEDFLGSSIAPQVMPPWSVIKQTGWNQNMNAVHNMILKSTRSYMNIVVKPFRCSFPQKVAKSQAVTQCTMYTNHQGNESALENAKTHNNSTGIQNFCQHLEGIQNQAMSLHL